MRACGVPDCNEPHVARNLCNRHYCIWKNLSEGFEEVLDYVTNITKPILGCDHERTGDNLLLEKNGRGYPSFKCRQCTLLRKKRNREKKKCLVITS